MTFVTLVASVGDDASQHISQQNFVRKQAREAPTVESADPEDGVRQIERKRSLIQTDVCVRSNTWFDTHAEVGKLAALHSASGPTLALCMLLSLTSPHAAVPLS
jgi:hypothetical protein